jgi:integrase
MATFRKVGSRWKAEVYVNGIRKSKTKDTKAEVKNWAAQAEFELGQLAQGTSTTHILNDVFLRYADEVSQLKKGAQWEIVRLKMFGRFPIASVKLLDLRREHFEKFILDRLAAPVKPSSVNRELNLISHCLTQARRWRLMDRNPMDDLKRPKDPPHRDRLIPGKEIDAILISLNYSEDCPVSQQQQRVAVAFLFAIESAMRAGEICALIGSNVDLVNRTAHLPDTKNGHARNVPLSTEAVRLLERLKPWPDTGGIFRLTSGTLSTIFKAGASRAGVEGLTFHDTRHEATTRLAAKLPVLDLARVTGHRDIKQLLTYYNKSAADLALLLS